ncbi:DUF2695 domain-containing protein [Flavobacterium branchiicola]|uniref:DUF2695 domain-containing protein n=1 Tax=Flavobacterium branchiicola TaxID=1114875 RepID=A0ABV9PMK0_9FLAO|nr:DUF2695 domain-containing protein [Flavobacterium branchiicola]MBS7256668.1 DUF2695 domain-containing protein [Flavobacterium branchiicola]
MDKKRRKEILAQINKENLIEFRQNLPLDENVFPKLFDFLDDELKKQGCNHSSSITQTFLQKTGVSNTIEVIEWLAENGGFCDCEILANVEDLFDYLNPPKTIIIPKKNIQKQKINSLKTDFDFCIEKVPSPWNLIEITATNGKEYLFQIGKSNNCTVNLQSPTYTFQYDNDEQWINLWINETELRYNIENLSIERFHSNNYSVIIVKTKDWVPVKIWASSITNPKWLLKMNTELSRYKGDIKALEKLLNSIV